MRVLASPFTAKANPYIDLFYGHLSEREVDVAVFSWAEMRKKRPDVCHINWPDLALSKSTIFGKIESILRFYFLVCWAKWICGAAIVWTVHNLKPHEPVRPAFLVSLFYWVWFRLIDGCIYLGESSRQALEEKLGRRIRGIVVPHGHYCDVYDSIQPSDYLRGRFGIKEGDFVLGHYGQIRAYKNIPELIRAFSKIEAPNCKLIIAGKVRARDESLRKEIEALSQADDRIHYSPEFIEDPEMLELYQLTDCAVLPYTSILNSGSAILALSLTCPVLVPDLPTMRELEEQVGAEHVALFASDLQGALENIVSKECVKSCSRSKLSALEWSILAEKTELFFQELIR